MKTKITIALSLLLTAVIYLTPKPLHSPAKPVDFRDAPADATLPALESLKAYGSFENNPIANVPVPAAAAVKEPAAATPPAAKEKEWTVMIYANAKDALGGAQIDNLIEMKKIGTTDKVNVVAETGLTQGGDNGAEVSTFRMVLTKYAGRDYGKAYESMTSDIVTQNDNMDMGDWRNAADFVKWAKANYPAKRYVFVVFGHGTGFHDPKKNPQKGVLIDEQTKNYVTLPEFGQLMKEAGHVDALVMYSCLMQMAETIYEVKDYADVIVGSGETMKSVGYDLRGMLRLLNSEPGIESKNLGAMLAHSYIKRAKAIGLNVHASVIATDKIPDFTRRLNDWADAALEANDAAALGAARNSAVRFDMGLDAKRPAARTSPFGDLYDFVQIYSEHLPGNTPQQRLAREKSALLLDYISRELVFHQAYFGKSTLGFDFARAHGLSIHLPMKARGESFFSMESALQTRYSDLAFARETRWKNFLDWAYSQNK